MSEWTCLITKKCIFHCSERVVLHTAAGICAVVNLGFCLLVRGCTNSKRNQWPVSMASGYSDVVTGVLTVCMMTLSTSMMWDQVTRGLLWKSEVSYKFPGLVVAVVLTLLGLVVVLVLGLCLFVYKYSVKCDRNRLFVCLWCILCVSMSAITTMTDVMISE